MLLWLQPPKGRPQLKMLNCLLRSEVQQTKRCVFAQFHRFPSAIGSIPRNGLLQPEHRKVTRSLKCPTPPQLQPPPPSRSIHCMRKFTGSLTYHCNYDFHVLLGTETSPQKQAHGSDCCHAAAGCRCNSALRGSSDGSVAIELPLGTAAGQDLSQRKSFNS